MKVFVPKRFFCSFSRRLESLQINTMAQKGTLSIELGCILHATVVKKKQQKTEKKKKKSEM